MNIARVAKELSEFIVDAPVWPLEPKKLNRAHILWMLDEIELKHLRGEKALIYIGYIQAACIYAGAITPEELDFIIDNG